MRDYRVIDLNTGELGLMISPSFVKANKAEKQLPALRLAYQTKLDFYMLIRTNTNPKLLKEYAAQLTLVEFEIQRLYGFPEDAKYHRFWETPKCKCPYFDNRDRYLTGAHIIETSCPLHGSK